MVRFVIFYYTLEIFYMEFRNFDISVKLPLTIKFSADYLLGKKGEKKITLQFCNLNKTIAWFLFIYFYNSNLVIALSLLVHKMNLGNWIKIKEGKKKENSIPC